MPMQSLLAKVKNVFVKAPTQSEAGCGDCDHTHAADGSVVLAAQTPEQTDGCICGGNCGCGGHSH